NTTIPLNILHRDLHALFLRCFNEGHKFPDRRPTAEEWRGTLEAALKEVIRCGKVDNHYYNRSYGKCYWCERSSDLNFDIFPGKSIATVTSTPLPKVAPPAPSSPPPPPAKLTPFTENLPNRVTLEMVSLPAGQFLMGSPHSDPDAASDEKPQHQVKVNSFAIGKYPVTQAQYEAVMGTNPSYFKNNPQNPVEKVSWDDAQAFCQKLSQITGKTYRLPTEAEWEYACRAGTTTRFYFGDDANQLGDYAWYDGSSQKTTHPVGQKRPNAWGLYDMSGNVWEWCEDDWHDNYIGAPKDGSAWFIKNDNRSQSAKCLLGGSWNNYPNFCRSASRYWYFPNFDFNFSGFRVACVSNVTSTQLPIANVTPTPLPKVSPRSPSSPPPPPAKLTPFTEKISKGITLEMVGLPAGKFLMGSPDSDPDAKSYEKPQHQVKINSFAIGKYPVTQAQYQAVMGTNPSHFSNNPQNPVEKVSWDDAQAFCQKLSQITGKTYRLPTEAEWEYACRAGTTTRFYFGDDANQLGDYAWYDGNSQDKTHPVGQKRPNAWGLYDMSGNVWEWCEDNSHNNYIGAPKDGSAWLTNDNDYHILRGGSWYDFPNYCRSAYDFTYFRRDYYYYVGFRVVCVPNVTSTQLPIATVTSTPSPKVAPPAPSSPPPPPAKLTPFTENLPKGITLEMVGLPAGQFLMGSPDSDPDAESFEKPQHQVKINSFAIGKYPITQAQYQAVMGINPSYFKINPQNPVEGVSWDDAQAFCKKLSQITGKTYRLPTEAEWEYACRAGTTTRYYFGDDANQLGDYAWYSGNSQQTTHPVGQKRPNAWGLYDMSGNVREWCEDNWHGNYIGAPKDGSAWLTNDSDYSIVRGGSWYTYPPSCRSAIRNGNNRRGFNNFELGFRVVCVPNVTSTQLPIATVTSTPLPKVAPPAPSSPPPPPAKLTPFTENLPNGLTLEMVGLPAGQFLMGSPDSDPDAESWEKPQHQVQVNSFAIGKYPVTQAQYQAVMGTNPSGFENNPQNPVEQVSWDDAQAFCQKLSQITGKTYRLPTEAEWEYACRAGTTTRYYFGDDANQLGDYAWYSGNSQQTTHPVGQKRPNAFGLYDMHGNVWEWCEDNWHNSYQNAPSDGSAWLIKDNDYQIVRGGSWYGLPNLCRSAYRNFNYRRGNIVNYFGFRVVCVPNVTSTQLPIATVTSTPLPKVAPPAPSSPPPPPAKLTPFTENLPNGLTLEMVGLPAGQFLMGSPDSDRDARDFEKPQHPVKINSFAIGKYPVTQAQYQAVMGTNPSHFYNNPQNPVERISWNHAQAFCQKLSQITGKTYRLPTEAEWEYACRAGTTTRFYFGDDANQSGNYAWYYKNSQQTTHPVGQKRPNAWGLYDMHGNVWEWCEDDWHDNYIGAPKDGSAWLTNDNDYQILRGGSWYDVPDDCRSAFRYYNYRRGNLFNYYIGFRVVCGAGRTL
ncbi:formylglycine-generating enzyme family protein, partial [Microcystis wesenbergii]